MIKVAVPHVGIEEEQAVIDVLRSGWYTSGPRVKEFEESYAEYVGVPHAVGVSSGTSAIYLTLQALGIGEGDEVIVPAMTFFSTATSVLRVGATPIFADVDRDSYNLSVTDTISKISDKTAAIIPVHFYGMPAEMNEYQNIGEKHDVHIIEDAAQAHGAEYRGKKVGGLSTAGCWSFFATKNMTCGCESGMVTTHDKELADKIRVLRSHGMTDRDTHSMLGYNDRLDEIAAAIGLVQLGKLDTLNQVRIYNSRYLRQKLRNVPWLKTPHIPTHVKHVFFWANFEVDEEKLGISVDDLRQRLMDLGIETRHRYHAPLYRQPILKDYLHLHDYTEDYCPVAEELSGKMIGLPNHQSLTKKDLDKVIKEITHMELAT